MYHSEGLKENKDDNTVLIQLWFVFSFSHEDNRAVNAAIINGVRSTDTSTPSNVIRDKCFLQKWPKLGSVVQMYLQ